MSAPASPSRPARTPAARAARRAPAARLGALGLALALAGACRATDGGGEAALLAAPRAEAPPLVVGTVVDARSGRPVAGATVTAPPVRTPEGDGDEGGEGEGERLTVTTDAQGRFRLKGLPAGTSGPLEARTPDGLVGRVRLRPLGGPEPVEVVIHVR